MVDVHFTGLYTACMILNLQEALAIKIKLPKFEEANEIHARNTIKAMEYSTRTQVYEHVRCDMILRSVCSVF